MIQAKIRLSKEYFLGVLTLDLRNLFFHCWFELEVDFQTKYFVSTRYYWQEKIFNSLSLILCELSTISPPCYLLSSKWFLAQFFFRDDPLLILIYSVHFVGSQTDVTEIDLQASFGEKILFREKYSGVLSIN